MKHIKTYESFGLTEAKKMKADEFEKIPEGCKIKSPTTTFTVVKNTGVTLEMEDERGKKRSVSLGQWNTGMYKKVSL